MITMNTDQGVAASRALIALAGTILYKPLPFRRTFSR
jgi:hypothetical protein